MGGGNREDGFSDIHSLQLCLQARSLPASAKVYNHVVLPVDNEKLLISQEALFNTMVLRYKA